VLCNIKHIQDSGLIAGVQERLGKHLHMLRDKLRQGLISSDLNQNGSSKTALCNIKNIFRTLD
jgi:hypothetical protein